MLLGLVAFGLLIFLSYLSQVRNEESAGTGAESVAATATYPYPLPTLLPLPPPPPDDAGSKISGMTLPEDWLHLYPYDPEAYPQFAEAMPAGTSCATWENGGLYWVNREGLPDFEAMPWGVAVPLHRFRFCGFPEPYPAKPE